MAFKLCEYSDIFGNPSEGIHKYKFMDIAIVDVIATFILSYGLHKIFKEISYLKMTAILFIVGIILHELFCVKTTVNKFLFHD